MRVKFFTRDKVEKVINVFFSVDIEVVFGRKTKNIVKITRFASVGARIKLGFQI